MPNKGRTAWIVARDSMTAFGMVMPIIHWKGQPGFTYCRRKVTKSMRRSFQVYYFVACQACIELKHRNKAIDEMLKPGLARAFTDDYAS